VSAEELAGLRARPLINGEIGSTTQRKRTACAELSAIVTETLGYIPPRNQGEPDHGDR
jgi:hypothetical protein